EDGTVRLWDIAGVQRAVLAPAGAGAAYALAWRPDGLALASGHADGSIRLWAAADQTENVEAQHIMSLQELHGHSAPVWALAWAPDRATLASTGADTTIRLWSENVEPQNSVALQERAVLRGHSVLILALAWHPNGRLLASGGADYSVRLWDG